ncbi:phycobilisome rod-core linker polypeptide [Chlorogloeopsis sp. ULAP02]|uniref:phycobilisome rod-core linker polypeptide n=1 Tax=Chlorogloeopsis sp. ULAP02 TaxID=3107926 RepID=UPI00313482AC
MVVPVLEYKPTTQNQRVSSFGTTDINEDTPYIYRLEDIKSSGEIEELIWAAYRQVFNEQEILQFNRQIALETQLKNKSITVRDFIRGLAKSDRFYQLVVAANNNYRLVEICLKRLLGRAPYNREEEIAWSIQIATRGWARFVDALIDSQEYEQAFSDNTVPYQRKRMSIDRPFSFTPRYGADYRDKAGIVKTSWVHDTEWYKFLAASAYPQKVDWRMLSAVLVGFSAIATFLLVLNWFVNSSIF